MRLRRPTHCLFILLSALVLQASVAFGASKPLSDKTPATTLTSPVTGTTYVAPAAITVSANAVTTVGSIAKVTFYSGNTVIGTDATAPYSIAWNNVPTGNYVVMAVATNNRGTLAASIGVNVSVTAPVATANVPPAVALTAPTSETSYVAPANVNLAANASDSDGTVTRVDFYAGTTLVGSSTAAPFSANWSNVPAGSYSFAAVATDNTGAKTTSAGVGATVAAAPPPGVPVVSLSSPANGSHFASPSAITLTAQASEAGGSIKSIVLFVAGSDVPKTVLAPPYTATWLNMPAGAYSLYALATDAAGVTTKSATITITLDPATSNVAPTVNLTAPATGTSYVAPATVNLAASASDSDGTVSKVDFFAGTTLVGTATTAPYARTWSNVAAGTYSMTAVATDNSGATTRSAAVSVTVNSSTSTNVPPTVSITAPASGTTYVAPATVYLTASGADSDGTVSKVDFYAGATMVGTTTTAPYAGTWSNVAAGTYAMTVVATDNSGATTRSAAVSITVNPGTSVPPSGGSDPLVQPSNLVYQGAFRVPAGLHAGGRANQGFEYGGAVIAHNPARDSLFMTGHDWDQFVGEIAIPAVLNGPLASLATASVLQPLTDVTEGRLPSINPTDPNAQKIGGLLPYMGKLFVSAYSYYDGAKTQVLSHFTSGLDLNVKGDVTGPFKVGTLPLSNSSPSSDAGFVAGYMGLVPAAWQATFGAPVITGKCCIAIVSRTSFGPAAFGIDPTQLGAQVPLPAAPLVYYPITNTLANWDATSTLFNGSTMMSGVVFPTATRSVLFFGRQGVGQFCYGAGTTIQSLDRTLDPNGVMYCYDPDDSSKGTHAYPYVHQVWAYDANNLAAVRNGQMQPWAVKPYATWQLNLPYSIFGAAHSLAAAYDAVTGRIFLSQTGWGADGALPIVHVFKVVP